MKRLIVIPDHARVDREIGARVRARREALGHSQAWLADQLGVTYQQVQKYEKGANRISASSLVTIADALGVWAWAFLAGVGADEREDAA